MYPPRIADELSRRGYDVLAAKGQRDLQQLEDEELLRRATLEGRVLVTDNTQDFMPILERFANLGLPHHGVLFTAHRSLPRLRRTIGLFVRSLEAYLREHPGDDELRDRRDWLRPI